MTDCILHGGDVENSATGDTEPQVVLRVTLSTNMFWFVKQSLALFRVLSQEFGIPVNCTINFDDNGFDLQVCGREPPSDLTSIVIL